jgi:hypothetical protein
MLIEIVWPVSDRASLRLTPHKIHNCPLDLLASLAYPPADKEMVAVRDLYTPPISVRYGYWTGSIISIRRNGTETETKYSTPTMLRVIANRHTDIRETDRVG